MKGCHSTVEALDRLWGLGVSLNTLLRYHKAKELASTYSKGTLGGVILELKVAKYLKDFFQILDVIFVLFGLDDHIIYIYLHIPLHFVLCYL